MNKFKFVLLLVVSTMLLSGCFWNKQVEANQVGLIMPDGVSIEQVVGPGRYSRWNPVKDWFAEMQIMGVSADTAIWTDPDLVTRDKQPIGLDVSVTYARMRDSKSVEAMWELYNSEARDRESLQQQVLTRIPRVAKDLTSRYTLDQMLGVAEDDPVTRAEVQGYLQDALAEELSEIYVQLLDVGINNIAPSEDYLDLLEQKANATVAVEVAQQETKRLAEQLEQEKAQTSISLEIAVRDNKVSEERAKVFEQSEQWFELTRLDKLARILGDKDKIYFVPVGTDLTLFLSGQATEVQPVPVEVKP